MNSGESGLTTWALEYECGCVREWGERDGFAGLFLTEPCPDYAPASAAASEEHE